MSSKPTDGDGPIRIALTFDDGPSALRGPDGRTPTEQVLDLLGERGIVTAFFVLTGPDEFRSWYGSRRVYAKGETDDGFAAMVRAAGDGHLLAVHWGGSYGSQQNLHPSRLAAPPYDVDGDGEAEGDCGLESDLIECRNRIIEAQSAAGIAAEVEFVRSPLWISHDDRGDARPVYQRLGLKLVTSDAKLFDGGYLAAGYTWISLLNRGLRRALVAGITSPVITLHDSNPRTARHLPKILAAIAKQMARLGYGTDDWRFVSDPDELRRALRRRRYLFDGPRGAR